MEEVRQKFERKEVLLPTPWFLVVERMGSAAAVVSNVGYEVLLSGISSDLSHIIKPAGTLHCVPIPTWE